MIKDIPTSRTALIAGATGLVGGELLSLILKDSTYNKVIILVRKELNLSNEKLEQHITDFDNLSLLKDEIKADDIFCCLGTTIKKAGSQEAFRKVDFFYPSEIARISLQNKAKQFLIISSIGADSSSKIFYSRVKGEIENVLMRMNFKSLNIFRPSLILGERKESRDKENIGKILFSILSPLMLGKLKKYRPIEASDIAAAMLITAKEFHPGIDVFENDRIQSIANILPRNLSVL